MKKLGILLLFVMMTWVVLQAGNAAKKASGAVKDSASQVTTAAKSVTTTALTVDQLIELERIKAGGTPDHPLGNGGIVIITIMPFLTAILIVFIVMYSKRKKEQQLMMLYQKAIESGRDIPEDFFKRPEDAPKSYLLKGLIWTGIGLGLSIGGLILMGFDSPWAFGLIPLLVGVAYGISYFVEQKHKKPESNNE
ncbi:MAG: DUF6249 domain-containing protein [Microbacter sp.]